ncbi:EAL domain-containing protein [Sulfurimonas sp. C5]|uniref:EAL domain-containing protein n=1 Tax=Sulfurimonas sp. C5 TaxID=3036947 RepID=UPI002458CA5C|nr:EAL domain-containing protein [Sulfurimonas sp. C5]
MHTYINEKDDLFKNIDKELLAGAYAVSTILEEDYHHKDLHSVSQEQDIHHMKDLQKYVQHTNLAYIYSFIKDKNGDIRFSSSSAPYEHIESGKKDIYSFAVYNDQTVAKVFETNQTVFENTSDSWGNFRSVYIPLQAQDGSMYVVGADYKIADIKSLQLSQTKKTLWVFLPLVLLTVLYFLIIALNMKQTQKTINEKTLRLRKVFETDKLTNLPNRTKLLQYLRKNRKIVLAIIDINNFKAINEIYGVKLADKFLKHLAYELHSIIKYDMNLYKLDNDLFCITSTNVDKRYFERYISKLLGKMEKIHFKDKTYSVSATYTAGVTHTEDIGNPILAAEYALENAKKTGKKVLSYSGTHEELNETTGKRKVLDDINYAIKNNKIFPYFQPIYNTQTKTVQKYEALVRMEKETGEVVAPWYFLQTAIDTGLYKHISKKMLERVVQKAKLHQDIGFSINISAIDIENESIKNNILRTIVKNNVEKQITLEILESEDFKNFQALINFAKEAQEHNIKLSIDDFGSGYSNFSHLIDIHFDYIKLDGSLVKNILKDERYEIVIKQILSFARELNSQVIAEFVEEKEVADKLIELGAVLLQGYYIGKPSENLSEGLSI